MASSIPHIVFHMIMIIKLTPMTVMVAVAVTVAVPLSVTVAVTVTVTHVIRSMTSRVLDREKVPKERSWQIDILSELLEDMVWGIKGYEASIRS